jgi:hypothetical protein
MDRKVTIEIKRLKNETKEQFMERVSLLLSHAESNNEKHLGLIDKQEFEDDCYKTGDSLKIGQ